MNLIELQPGDVLVLRCPGKLTKAQCDEALAGLSKFIGPDRNVIILDGGQELDVLRGVADAALTENIPAQTGIPVREVQHVDTDEEEPSGIPPHVWLYRNMLADLQAVAPLGRDETNGQYAVAIDQLTDEQRAIPHVRAQLPGDALTVAAEGEVAENEIVRRIPT